MRIIRLLTLVAALVSLGGAVSACGGSSDSGGASNTPAPSTGYAAESSRAVEEVAAGAALLDVRRQDEWDAGHAAGAQLLPIEQIEGGALPKVEKDERLFVYCASGRRAGIAVKILQEAGYTDVVNIGGLADWQQAGGQLAPQ